MEGGRGGIEGLGMDCEGGKKGGQEGGKEGGWTAWRQSEGREIRGNFTEER